MSDYWDDWFRRWRRWWRSPFFFPDIERMFSEMEKEIEEAFKEIRSRVPEGFIRERRLPDGSKVREFGPFVYGYSITFGPDGKPVVREFGNIKPSLRRGMRPTIDLRERREPLVDVFEDNNEIKVIAELPGVEKKDIKLYATENRLTISVDTPERKYYKELELPAEVDYNTAKTSYRNGILEVVLKKKERKGKGVQLKVE